MESVPEIEEEKDRNQRSASRDKKRKSRHAKEDFYQVDDIYLDDEKADLNA
jgi:hypothetical protein